MPPTEVGGLFRSNLLTMEKYPMSLNSLLKALDRLVRRPDLNYPATCETGEMQIPPASAAWYFSFNIEVLRVW
jgi:hypothetical protein